MFTFTKTLLRNDDQTQDLPVDAQNNISPSGADDKNQCTNTQSNTSDSQGSSVELNSVTSDTVVGENASLSLSAVAWTLFCASTALQPMFNSAAVGDYFSTGSKCDVGDPACYMIPQGNVPGLNITLALFGLIANTVITVVFLPLAFETLQKMWEDSKCSPSIGGAIAFGCAAAAVSFQLSRESFALGDGTWYWECLNWALIILAVIPTFCSRFTGSHKLLNLSWRIKPQIEMLLPRLYPKENMLAWVITARNDLLRSVYSLPRSELQDMTADLKEGRYDSVINRFYHSDRLSVQDAPQGQGVWLGLNVTYARTAAYWSAQAAFTVISLAASLIVYNINYGLMLMMAKLCVENSNGQNWFARPSAVLLTAPATLYYLYSLSNLPDRMFRSHALACQVNDSRIWLSYIAIYVTTIGSCGNLLYSGMTQGLNGDFDWTHISPEAAMGIMGVFGALISSLCNLFALLGVFEQVVAQSFGLAECVKNFEDTVERYVAKARAELTANRLTHTRNPLPTGDNDQEMSEHDDAENGLRQSLLSEADCDLASRTAFIAKNFYAQFSSSKTNNGQETGAAMTKGSCFC